MTTEWTKKIGFKSSEETITVLGKSLGTNDSPIVVNETTVKIDKDSVNPEQYGLTLGTSVENILQAFPEVSLIDTIVDQGIPSIDLVERVENLQEQGFPLTLIDLYEYLTPCSIAAHVSLRIMRGEHDVNH